MQNHAKYMTTRPTSWTGILTCVFSARHIAYLIVGLTLLKIAAVVFHSPIFGYANNYDFVRKSACVGIWQNQLGRDKTANHPEAPVNNLIFDGDRINPLCAKSSDNFFAHISRKLHKVGDRIDFREMSVYRWVMLMAMVLLLMRVTDNERLKIIFSLLFFLVWGDFAIELYFNTLYNEFSVVMGCFFAASCVVLLTQRSMPPHREKATFSLLVFSIVWLGFSKQQYVPLASLLALLAALIMILHRRRWKMFLLLMCALMLPLLYARLNNDASGLLAAIDQANKTNTFMAAVLPAVADQPQALQDLGLPPSCLAAIGKSWYDPQVQQNNPCPEVKQLSRLDLFKLFWREPAAAYIPLYRGILEANKMYPNYLGYVEQPSQLENAWYRTARFGSLTILLSTLPGPLFFGITVGSLLFSALSGMVLALRFARGRNDQLRLDVVMLSLIVMGGLLIFYALVSSVFGDGYWELPKHAVVLGQGFAFQLCGIGLAGWLIAEKAMKLKA